MTAKKRAKSKAESESAVILAAGGVVWRKTRKGPVIAVIHRPRYDDWSLPKGKLKEGESFEEAALREVREETGFDVRVTDLAGETRYEYEGVHKIALYWNMQLNKEPSFKKSKEADKLEWLSLKDASQKINYEEQKDIIANLNKDRKPYLFKKLGFFRSKSIRVRRLLRSIRSLGMELERKIEYQKQEGNLDPTWANAARTLLNAAEDAMSEGNINTGWKYLHAAGRMEIFGLNEKELQIKATLLRHEAEKLSSWRKAATYDLLGDPKRPKQTISKETIYQAAVLRDEHSGNLYLKIDRRRRSLLNTFIGLSGILVLLPFLLEFKVFQDQIWNSNILWEVELFGALGALLSVSMTLTRASVKAKIPDQLIGSFVTWMRPVIGASAAVAIFIFLRANLLGSIVSSELNNSIYGILTISFVAGFSERFIIKAVGSVTKEKK